MRAKVAERQQRLREATRRLALAWLLASTCLAGHLTHLWPAAPGFLHVLHKPAVAAATSVLAMLGAVWCHALLCIDSVCICSVPSRTCRLALSSLISPVNCGAVTRCNITCTEHVRTDNVAAVAGPGRGIMADGWEAARRGAPDMNTLVALGASAAFGVSCAAAGLTGLGWRTFFEEPAMLLGFVLVGRTLEERAKLQASSDLVALQVCADHSRI